MPIYLYKCEQCSQYTEALQKASDPQLTTCSACQAESLIRVIAPVGVIFKGTGFHKNDYSGKSKTSPSQAENPSKEGSSSAGEGVKPNSDSAGSSESASSSEANSSKSSGSETSSSDKSGSDKVA